MNRLELLTEQIAQTKQFELTPNMYQFAKVSTYPRGVAGYISIYSPKDFNCLDKVMLNQLREAIKKLNADKRIKVIVIYSEVPNIYFTSAPKTENVDKEFSGVIEAINARTKPIVAAVNGKTLGAGFELTLLCDAIAASEKSTFGFPDGLIPSIGGSKKLAKMLDERGMKYILSKEILASEAWSLKIATQISSKYFTGDTQKFAEKVGLMAKKATVVKKQ